MASTGPDHPVDDLTGKAVRSSAARARIEEIVEIGRAIKRRVDDAKISVDDKAGRDRLLTTLRAEFKDFAHSFPLPLRWTIQTGEFSAKALDQHIRADYKETYADRHAFLEAQGEYLVKLYKVLNPRADATKIRKRREWVRKMLKEEDESFTKAREEADAETKRIEKEIVQKRRERLRVQLIALKEKMEAERASGVSEEGVVTMSALTAFGVSEGGIVTMSAEPPTTEPPAN